MEPTVNHLRKTPSLAIPTDPEPTAEPQPSVQPASDEEISRAMGFPGRADQQKFDKTRERVNQRRAAYFNPNAFVKPVDPATLSEEGKAYREKLNTLTRTPTQLNAILGKLDQSFRVSARRQALDYETALVIVREVLAREGANKTKKIWFTDEQKEILVNIIKYFIADPSGAYALHKGLFLYGKFGVGKDMIFRAMQWLCKVTPIDEMQFTEIPCKLFVERYVDYKESQEKGKKGNPIFQYHRGNLLLQDLGEEPQAVTVYAKTYYPMQLLLTERNVAFDKYSHKTHVSSNLGLGPEENALEKDLNALYPPHIVDRFYDQFEAIHFKGDSKRGENC